MTTDQCAVMYSAIQNATVVGPTGRFAGLSGPVASTVNSSSAISFQQLYPSVVRLPGSKVVDALVHDPQLYYSMGLQVRLTLDLRVPVS